MKSRKQSVTLRLARSLGLGQPPQPSMLRAWSPNARRWLTAMPRRRTGGAARRQRRHAQDHTGQDKAISAARHASYTRTRALHSTRWPGATRNGLPIEAVALNSQRDPAVKTLCVASRMSMRTLPETALTIALHEFHRHAACGHGAARLFAVRGPGPRARAVPCGDAGRCAQDL